jgi:cell division protein FtsB
MEQLEVENQELREQVIQLEEEVSKLKEALSDIEYITRKLI